MCWRGRWCHPGGRCAQSRRPLACQHVCLLHGDCKPNSTGGKKYHRRARKHEHPSQSTGHSTWVLGTTDPVLSLHHVSLLCPQVPRYNLFFLTAVNVTSLSVHTTLVSDRPLKADGLTKPVSEMKLIPFKSCVWCGVGRVCKMGLNMLVPPQTKSCIFREAKSLLRFWKDSSIFSLGLSQRDKLSRWQGEASSDKKVTITWFEFWIKAFIHRHSSACQLLGWFFLLWCC